MFDVKPTPSVRRMKCARLWLRLRNTEWFLVQWRDLCIKDMFTGRMPWFLTIVVFINTRFGRVTTGLPRLRGFWLAPFAAGLSLSETCMKKNRFEWEGGCQGFWPIRASCAPSSPSEFWGSYIPVHWGHLFCRFLWRTLAIKQSLTCMWELLIWNRYQGGTEIKLPKHMHYIHSKWDEYPSPLVTMES